MRLQEPVIKIAIYGSSATGKSASCGALAKLLKSNNVSIRHCGQIVKERAKLFGYQLQDGIPEKLHKDIDSETREFASNQACMVIEGRYLHYVLSQSNAILFIELTAGIDERAVRVARRDLAAFDLARAEIIKSDKDDEELIKHLYKKIKPINKPHFTFDTSNLTIVATAELIMEAIAIHHDKTR